MKKSYFLFILALCFVGLKSKAATITAGASTNWSLTTTWIGGVVPQTADSVVIPAGVSVNMNLTDTCKSLNLLGTLRYSANGVTLRITNVFEVGATGLVTTSANNANRDLEVLGTFNLVSGANLSIPGIDFRVASTSTINGTLTFIHGTGTKTFTGNTTLNNGAAIVFATNAETLNISGSLICNGTNTITCNIAAAALATNSTIINGTTTISGSVTGSYTNSTTLDVATGATLNVSDATFTVTTLSTINGILNINGALGNKTLTGAVTLNNGGAINMNAAETLTMSNSFTANGTNTIDNTVAGAIITVVGSGTINGTTTIGTSTASTGDFTIGTTLDVPIGAILNVGEVNFAVTGLTTLDGRINHTSSNGTKAFGGFTINATGNWDCSAVDELFTISGNITNNGTFSASNSSAAGSSYTITGTRQATGIFLIPNLVTGTNLTNNGTITVTNTLGGAALTQGANSSLTLDVSDANYSLTTLTATANGNTVAYDFAGAQTSHTNSYYNLSISKSGTKSLAAATTVSNDLLISGSAVLDVTVSNRQLNVAGNWTVTSTAPDPFVENNGTVQLNGTAVSQTITSPLAQETFYKLTVNNTSGLSPAIISNQNILITSEYDHTAGVWNLKGNDLTITSAPGAANGLITCTLSGGSIISDAVGSAISFTDTDDSTYVNFTGTDVGTLAFPIPLTINTGKVCIGNMDLHGVGSFTKTLANDDVCALGGNRFYNNVTFTATNSASRWRMGDGGTPDTCFANATFNAFANGGTNNNFIIGVSSLGNCYYGTTSMNSTTIGGFFVGRSNGGTSNSHTFKGPVVVDVSLTGNITFAEANANPNNCTFESTLRLNSLATSTGDINIGANNANSSITFTNTGRLIDGTILGATNVNFYHVTQNGGLAQSTVSGAATNSIITVGSLNAPCTWNGSLTLTSPNINLAYSTFNGTTNLFTANGTASQNSTGGNTFASGTTTRFTNAGAGNWNLGNTVADDFNGVTQFLRNGAGNLVVSTNTNSTFSGNIEIRPTSDSVVFGTGAASRITFDGNATTTFTNNGTKNPSFYQVTMDRTGGNLTLNDPLIIRSGGDLLLTNGNITTTPANFLSFLDENVSTNLGSATSFVDGPMKINVSTGAAGTDLTFPVGRGGYSSPFSLTMDHATAVNTVYTGEAVFTDAMDLGYTFGTASIDTVSQVRYYQVDCDLASAITSGAITIYYDGTDGVVDQTQLRVAKTIGAGTVWFDIGGAGSAAPAGQITSSVNFTTFSKFALADIVTGSNPLPIELVNLNAENCKENICLNWTTATEINNDRFVVEKSIDGVNFIAIGEVDSKTLNGNSTSNLNYNLVDYNASKGINYYRLNQFDFNGQNEYSYIVSVVKDEASNVSFSVYPNPSNGTFAIDFSDIENNHDAIVKVMDMKGALVYSKVIEANELKTTKFLVSPEKQLEAGQYLLNISINGYSQSVKIIVQ
jgi:hypothetical protein